MQFDLTPRSDGLYDRRRHSRATVAQSAEHRFRKAGVDGSTPFGGSRYKRHKARTLWRFSLDPIGINGELVDSVSELDDRDGDELTLLFDSEYICIFI